MQPKQLTWTLLLGLLATGATGACSRPGSATSSGGSSSSGGSHGSGPKNTEGDEKVYPVGHPCHGKGNCNVYIRLPDGGAAAVGESDAGRTTLCGPCNG